MSENEAIEKVNTVGLPRPTWEILEFGENTDDIRFTMDWACVCFFEYKETGYIEAVIGENFVFRGFESNDEYVDVKNAKQLQAFKSELREIRRIVFIEDKIIEEHPNHTRKEISLDDIFDSQRHDIDLTKYVLADVNIRIYNEFCDSVKLKNKDKIAMGFMHDKEYKGYGICGIYAFWEIYKRLKNNKPIDDSLPEIIRKELITRRHNPHTAVKVTKNLAVIVDEYEYRYLKCKDKLRIYVDDKDLYFLKQNAITHEWESDDFEYHLKNASEAVKRYSFKKMWRFDKYIFKNTCMESYFESAIDDSLGEKNGMGFADFVIRKTYLCAEQAAKISAPLYYKVRENIVDRYIEDRTKSLKDILGLNPPQFKFLLENTLPDDLTEFGKYMQDEQFVEHFPDVEKRVFAVLFYIDYARHLRYIGRSGGETEQIFAAAQTINSIEKLDRKVRDRVKGEYLDYLRMYRTYTEDMRLLPDDSRYKKEVEKYGEFPLNMKPSSIHYYHQLIGKPLDLLYRYGYAEMFTEGIKQRKEEEAKDWEYTNGKYSMLLPKDANEIVAEGRELHHCVGRGGYIEAMARKRCTLLFLRDNVAIDKPLITIEVRNKALVQCYGFGDKYNDSKEIKDFIEYYCGMKNIRIDATIYAE